MWYLVFISLSVGFDGNHMRSCVVLLWATWFLRVRSYFLSRIRMSCHIFIGNVSTEVVTWSALRCGACVESGTKVATGPLSKTAAATTWFAKFPLDYMLHNTFLLETVRSPQRHVTTLFSAGGICPQPHARLVTVAYHSGSIAHDAIQKQIFVSFWTHHFIWCRCGFINNAPTANTKNLSRYLCCLNWRNVNKNKCISQHLPDPRNRWTLRYQTWLSRLVSGSWRLHIAT